MGKRKILFAKEEEEEEEKKKKKKRKFESSSKGIDIEKKMRKFVSNLLSISDSDSETDTEIDGNQMNMPCLN